MNSEDIETATEDLSKFVAAAVLVVSLGVTSPIWLPFYILRKLRSDDE